MRVTVEPEMVVEELRYIARSISRRLRESRPYDALSVGFADAPQYLERGAYPLGYWYDAPYGRWSDASKSAPDYSNLVEKDCLRNKDWVLRPTLAQVELWAKFGDCHPEPEEIVIAELAEQGGRAFSEIQTDLYVVAHWITSGQGCLR